MSRRGSVVAEAASPSSAASVAQQQAAAPEKPAVGKTEIMECVEKSVFSTEPLPKYLCFRGMDHYLLVLPHIGYVDAKYGQRKLVSQFVLTLALIKSTENDLQKLLHATRNALNEAYSKNLTPYTQTMTTENAPFWRKRVVLSLKQVKLTKKVQLAKLDACYQNLETIKKLKRVVSELIKRPRNVALNQLAISRLFSSVKNEIETRRQIRIKAIDQVISEIKIGMKFIPRLFSKPEICPTIIFAVLQAAVRLRDPLTLFLPETLEATTFADFIQSRFSPIRYTESKPEPIENLIELTVEMMRSFAAVKAPEQVQVLSSLSVRYWFNRILILDKDFEMGNANLCKYLFMMKNKKVSSQKIPKLLQQFLKPFMELTIEKFMKGDKNINPAIEQLLTCAFQNSPVEIAYYSYLIHLRLSGYVAGIIKKDISDKNTLECSTFFWRLLLITSDLPYPETMYAFISKYAQSAFVPQVLFEKCSVPIQVLQQLTNESKK